jgi:hypothetical protein
MVCQIGSLSNPFSSDKSIFSASFASLRDLNKDPNTWLDGARPSTMSLIMSSTNCLFELSVPTIIKWHNFKIIFLKNGLAYCIDSN